jgi:hypothetical protein
MDTGKELYTAIFQERHPDKEITFLGIFSSEEKAQEACDRHEQISQDRGFYTIYEGFLDLV